MSSTEVAPAKPADGDYKVVDDDIKVLMRILESVTSQEGRDALKSDAPIGSHPCSICENPAQEFCSACAGHPTPDRSALVTVYYCGSECREKDRKIHERLCTAYQDRILMKDAHMFLTVLWTVYRKRLFDRHLTGIKVVGKNYLILEDGPCEKALDSGFLGRLPESLFNHEYPAESKWFRNMKLLWAAAHFETSQEALACLYPVLEQLMKGKIKDIKQVLIRMKNTIITPILRTHHSGLGSALAPNLSTLIWKIKLQSGETWALDPTSLHHGKEYFDAFDLGGATLPQAWRTGEKKTASTIFDLLTSTTDPCVPQIPPLKEFQDVSSEKRRDWCTKLPEIMEEHVQRIAKSNELSLKTSRRSDTQLFMLNFSTATEQEIVAFEKQEFRKEDERVGDRFGPLPPFQSKQKTAEMRQRPNIFIKDGQGFGFAWKDHEFKIVDEQVLKKAGPD